ncbi:MAG: hypothetical protein EOQ52_16240 [Mesorhizobium sp.]|uniref:hypothetical protein n=1 Tax=Mesorhizobium sp. TaxID=1871066 RepID=UPI000FE904DC|nr:hypothetical protein [Mesorhizobium sp.]RWB67980.1 MAG: hypothetical protein EOQ49_24215 [Mesorhizobium sp.]RWB87736.1 MAG: hypothetical protein EOQ52_16240 [Mesorhizobium sp.]
MPLIAFHETVDERRFRRLARLLEGIRSEIGRESAELQSSGERMEQCAAFSLEAMDNGEDSKRLSAKVDALARTLAMNRVRQASLEEQIALVDGARAGLSRILDSHRV